LNFCRKTEFEEIAMSKTAVASTLSVLLALGLANAASAENRMLLSTTGTIQSIDTSSRTIVFDNGLAFTMGESVDITSLEEGSEICVFCGEANTDCRMVMATQIADAPPGSIDNVAPADALRRTTAAVRPVTPSRGNFVIVATDEATPIAIVNPAEPAVSRFEIVTPAGAQRSNVAIVDSSTLPGRTAVMAVNPAAAAQADTGIVSPDELRNDPNLISPDELRNDPRIISPDELRNDPRIVSPDELRNDPRIVSPDELRNDPRIVSPDELRNDPRIVSPDELMRNGPTAPTGSLQTTGSPSALRSSTATASPAPTMGGNTGAVSPAEPARSNTGTASPMDPPADSGIGPR
jgi:hypothetical protein